MSVVTRYVGSAVVAATLAVLFTLYGFSMPLESALQTGLLAAAVALAVVYLNTRRRAPRTETRHS